METNSHTPRVEVCPRDFDAITSGDLRFVHVRGSRSLQRGDVLIVLACTRVASYRQRSSNDTKGLNPTLGLSAHVVEVSHVVAGVDGLEPAHVALGFKPLITNGVTGRGWIVSEVETGSDDASRG